MLLRAYTTFKLEELEEAERPQMNDILLPLQRNEEYDNANRFFTSYENLSSHIADGSLVTTDNTSSYDRLLREKGCFHKSCPDCTDHNAEVNLNRINSFHSMIKAFYRGYRGVATKYINRYASLFSFTWKYGDELFEAVREMMAKGRQSLTIAEVENFRLFMPQDIEWRPAV